MYLHSLHFTAWVQSPVGVSMWVQFSTWDPTTIYLYIYVSCILCMGPILCIGQCHQYYLHFPAWAQLPMWWPFCTKDTVPTTMYLNSLYSLCGLNSLCGSPPPIFPAFPYMGSILCMVTFCTKDTVPFTCTYIPNILYFGPILSVGPNHQYSLCFPVWLHSLHGDLFALRSSPHHLPMHIL